jgi:5-methylcytosine-specific restriction endonuclease McrA
MLKEKILKLRSEGLSYNQIAKKLDCSKGSVSYYCGKEQKEKSRLRVIKSRSIQHPYKRKTERFTHNKPKPKQKLNPVNTDKKLIYVKIRGFHMDHKSNKPNDPTFTFEDVVEKFGENPKCYLTGDPIDISKPRTYQFDHIIPRSRGGLNALDNLGICTKQANMSKQDMTRDEFINFCKKIINNSSSS